MLTQQTQLSSSGDDDLIEKFFIPYIINHFNTDADQSKNILIPVTGREKLKKSPIEFLADQGQWSVIKKIADKLPVSIEEKCRAERHYGDVYAYGYALSCVLEAASVAKLSEKKEVPAEMLNCAYSLLKAGACCEVIYKSKYCLDYAIRIQDEKIVLAILSARPDIPPLFMWNEFYLGCQLGNAKIASFIQMYTRMPDAGWLLRTDGDKRCLEFHDVARTQHPSTYEKAVKLTEKFKQLANIIYLISLGPNRDYMLCNILVDLWP